MNYFTTPNAFTAANKASLEALQNLVASTQSRAERLAALNMEVLRSVLEDGAATARTLLEIKQPQDLAKLQQDVAQPVVDKFVDYSRSVFEIASEGQQELSKLVEAQIAEVNQAFAEALARAEKSAPAGSEPLFAGVKQAIATANEAYAEFTKLVKQATETLEANLAAAKKAVVPVSALAPAPAPKRTAAKKDASA
ncbi:phasin family protein [Thauera sinica]|uniref:TIGR01841 family phasin n=1 Tax=Thauera sinica TaxID=2665146 RepID=A0ABW1AS66_9RHOO|nr:phasin family protein [Thauera sp. K11]ATE61052.1 granule-associated-like protein [Thauera sp. K11]